MMTRARLFAAAALFGCGSDPFVHHVEDPQPLPGGGVGSGAIARELNVFVIDADSGAAIAGAEVRVGGAEIADPVIGTTDTGGFVRLEDGALEGPQVVTAVADGYAVATWFGVDGAVVTIPLATADVDEAVDAPPTATISGTILGWEDIPDPDAGFALAALITFSRTDDPADSEVAIEQDPHPTLSGLLPNLTANTCLRFRVTSPIPLDVDTCDWTLRTRTGPQTVYALVALLDINALATGDVGSGDFQVVGYASTAGLDPDENDALVENLEMFSDSDLIDTTIAVGELPDALDRTTREAVIDLGDPGHVHLPPRELTALVPTLDVDRAFLPEATGDFEGSYAFFATGLEEGTSEYPVSRLARHDSEPGDVDLGEWLAPPAGLAGDPATRTYSFVRVEGASVHDLSIDDTDGTRAYDVVVLAAPAPTADGGVPSDVISLTLPALPVEPLPDGNLHLTVRGTEIPGFDPASFSGLGDALARAARQSEDRFRISR